MAQGWDEATARLAKEGQGEDEAAAGALAEVCERAQRLGERFFPNDVAFPGAHVAQRLEQTASGLWPERGATVDDADAVPSAMLHVSFSPLPAPLEARIFNQPAFSTNQQFFGVSPSGSPQFQPTSIFNQPAILWCQLYSTASVLVQQCFKLLDKHMSVSPGYPPAKEP